jgi:hypothetical protein
MLRPYTTRLRPYTTRLRPYATRPRPHTTRLRPCTGLPQAGERSLRPQGDPIE